MSIIDGYVWCKMEVVLKRSFAICLRHNPRYFKVAIYHIYFCFSLHIVAAMRFEPTPTVLPEFSEELKDLNLPEVQRPNG